MGNQIFNHKNKGYSKPSIRLHGRDIPVEGAHATILFAHGQRVNISHRLEKIKFFNELGVNVFIFDYRGYGRNEGKPQEQGLYNDIQSAYEYILKNQKGNKITL